MENRADLGRVPRGGGGKETSCFGDDIGKGCFAALKISYSKCCTVGALSTTSSPAQRMIGERAISELRENKRLGPIMPLIRRQKKFAMRLKDPTVI